MLTRPGRSGLQRVSGAETAAVGSPRGWGIPVFSVEYEMMMMMMMMI